MRVRALLLTGVAIAASLSAVANAAPAKSCNLVADPKGDTNNDLTVEGQTVKNGFPASESVDLVGADLASDGSKVTAVIKLSNIDPDEQAVINRRYVLQFKPAGSKYPLLLAALVDPLGETYNFGYYGPSASGTSTNPLYNYPGTATGRIEGGNVIITANLADMAGVENVGKFPTGAKINGLTAFSFRRHLYPAVGVPPVGGRVHQADTATSKATYTAGAPSCVKIG